MRRLAPLLLSALLLAPATARAQSLVLVDEQGIEKTLTAAQLKAMPQVEIRVREKDSSFTTFRGPTLRGLMTLAGAPTGRALRGPSMLLAIVADAPDGYSAGYMLADVDEQFGARAAIVAIAQDGKALPTADGPLRVIVQGEEHRARWVRNVAKLRLVRIGK